MKAKSLNRPGNIQIWIGFFLYTLLVGLIIQLVVLPHIFPAWNAGDGLLKGLDTEKFNQYILKNLEQIKINGWDTWVLKSRGNPILGVAVLFYGFLSPHPWAMLPLNSVLNAFAGLSIFLILEGFIKDRKLALLATLPYLLFPTSLSWTAQFHNDNYMVAGVALFLLGWFQVSSIETWSNWKKICLSVIEIFFGSMLIWFVRNYVLNILEILSLPVAIYLSLCLVFWMLKKKIVWKRAILAGFILWFSIGMVFAVSKLHLVNEATRIQFGSTSSDSGSLVDQSTDVTKEETSGPKNKQIWTRTLWIPAEIDNKLKDLINTRENAFKPTSGSNLDEELVFTNSVDVLRYLPRAVEIGFLAPFPYQWFQQGRKAPNTMMRRVAGFEMIFIYLSYVGLIYSIWKWRRFPGLWTFLFICGGMIVIYALAVVNVGTLHRFRYGFLMPLVGLGVLGWVEIIKKLFPKITQKYTK